MSLNFGLHSERSLDGSAIHQANGKNANPPNASQNIRQVHFTYLAASGGKGGTELANKPNTAAYETTTKPGRTAAQINCVKDTLKFWETNSGVHQRLMHTKDTVVPNIGPSMPQIAVAQMLIPMFTAVYRT